MKKTIAMLLALIMIAACFSACGASGTTQAPAEKEPEQPVELVVDLSDITIGACVMSLQHEFMANLVKGY